MRRGNKKRARPVERPHREERPEMFWNVACARRYPSGGKLDYG